MDSLVHERLPTLSGMVSATAFDMSEFYSTLIAGLFTDLGMPMATVLRIWDLFMADGCVLLTLDIFLHSVKVFERSALCALLADGTPSLQSSLEFSVPLRSTSCPSSMISVRP